MFDRRYNLEAEHPDSVGKHCSMCVMGQTIFVDNQEEYRTLQNSGLMELIDNDTLARALQGKYVQHEFLRKIESTINESANTSMDTYFSTMESTADMAYFKGYIPLKRWNGAPLRRPTWNGSAHSDSCTTCTPNAWPPARSATPSSPPGSARRSGLGIESEVEADAVPRQEQEVLMRIADMMIWTYTAESLVLRVQKLAGQRGEDAVAHEMAMMKVYCYEVAERMHSAGKEALLAFAEGDELKGMLMGLKRFTKTEPFNTDRRPPAIAQKLIEENEYCW